MYLVLRQYRMRSVRSPSRRESVAESLNQSDTLFSLSRGQEAIRFEPGKQVRLVQLALQICAIQFEGSRHEFPIDAPSQKLDKCALTVPVLPWCPEYSSFARSVTMPIKWTHSVIGQTLHTRTIDQRFNRSLKTGGPREAMFLQLPFVPL